MNKSEIEQLRGLVIERVDMSREPDDSELHEIIDSVIEKNQDYRYMSIKKRQIIHKKIYSSIRGLGIIEELLEEPDITEIMINGPNNIFVEKKGRINKIDERFESENRLNDIIQQIVAKTNRRVNESNPIVDTRLEDGSRVNVILPPIALEGPIVTIRKFSKRGITIDDMISWGTISNISPTATLPSSPSASQVPSVQSASAQYRRGVRPRAACTPGQRRPGQTVPDWSYERSTARRLPHRPSPLHYRDRRR